MYLEKLTKETKRTIIEKGLAGIIKDAQLQKVTLKNKVGGVFKLQVVTNIHEGFTGEPIKLDVDGMTHEELIAKTIGTFDDTTLEGVFSVEKHVVLQGYKLIIKVNGLHYYIKTELTHRECYQGVHKEVHNPLDMLVTEVNKRVTRITTEGKDYQPTVRFTIDHHDKKVVSYYTLKGVNYLEKNYVVTNREDVVNRLQDLLDATGLGLLGSVRCYGSNVFKVNTIGDVELTVEVGYDKFNADVRGFITKDVDLVVDNLINWLTEDFNAGGKVLLVAGMKANNKQLLIDFAQNHRNANIRGVEVNSKEEVEQLLQPILKDILMSGYDKVVHNITDRGVSILLQPNLWYNVDLVNMQG